MKIPNRNLGPLLVASVLFASGCELFSASGASALATGSYNLVSYNGTSLPSDLGSIPSKGANPDGCALRIVAGRLTLEASVKTFFYSYDIHNGCSNEFMSRPSLQGSYEQSGRELVLVVRSADGVEFRHSGSLRGSKIVFEVGDETLEFVR